MPDGKEFDVQAQLRAALRAALEQHLSKLNDASGPAEIEEVLNRIADQDWASDIEVETWVKLIRAQTKQPIAFLRGHIKNRRRTKKSNKPQIEGLIANRYGEPASLESNAVVLIRKSPELRGMFALDEFQQRSMIMRAPPWAKEGDTYPRPTRDSDMGELLAWVQQQGVFLRGLPAIRGVLATVIRDRVFHQVRVYLDALRWDETPRLDRMAGHYFGVAPIPGYTDRVCTCWMISAVARIYEPGCMAKYVLILEGPQDLGKSAALEALFTPFFSDDIAELGTKDSALQVGNAWCVELSELTGMRRAEINAVKAFISRKVDRFRPPYGTHPIEQPRQCVLAGTVNPNGNPYFADDTGAVRFWPLTCTKIDISALRRDRNQLFAEAVHRYRAGEKWWMEDDAALAIARGQQAARLDTEIWTQAISEWLDSNAINSTTIRRVLSEALNIADREQDKPKQTRVGIVLKRLGWERDEDAKRVGIYRRTSTP